MTGEESKQIVRDYQAALVAGDIETAKALVSPEATYWTGCIPPRWGEPMSRDEFFAGVASFAEQSTGDWQKFTYGPIIAEGPLVALQGASKVKLRNGKVYNNFYHVYFEVRDGLIVTVREFLDTLHVVECFNGSDASSQPVRHSPFENG